MRLRGDDPSNARRLLGLRRVASDHRSTHAARPDLLRRFDDSADRVRCLGRVDLSPMVEGQRPRAPHMKSRLGNSLRDTIDGGDPRFSRLDYYFYTVLQRYCC